ncbi:MAG: hypothetical protein KF887_16575 [Paracoccaceae bacterium]|nr:MAG: hypothetical protein KF887_16575 [Paracoccaceae bacterium]
MRKPLLAMMVVVLAVSACGRIRDSRLNPFNWFGRSQPAEVVVTDAAVAQDGRRLVAQVIDLTLDRTPGGAILRAVGLPPTQGYWEAELVARPVDDGVLVFDFRVFPPPRPADVSTQRSREVVVATFLSNQMLEGLRQITVQGELSARSTRR